MKDDVPIYSSSTNPLFGSQPKGWQQIFVKIESILIIPYALFIVLLCFLLIPSIKFTSFQDVYFLILIVISSIIIISVSFLILVSLLKTINLSILSEGLSGDFSQLGIICKIKEMRIWTNRFFSWDKIRSIHVSSFKTIHLTTTDNLQYVTSVANVLDFVKSLKKSGYLNKFDLKTTKSLLSSGWAYGQGVIGMCQSSKEFSKLSDQIEEALK